VISICESFKLNEQHQSTLNLTTSNSTYLQIPHTDPEAEQSSTSNEYSNSNKLENNDAYYSNSENNEDEFVDGGIITCYQKELIIASKNESLKIPCTIT